jgi:hypothetical protein
MTETDRSEWNVTCLPSYANIFLHFNLHGSCFMDRFFLFTKAKQEAIVHYSFCLSNVLEPW